MLHVFDAVCNLINADGDILSLVISAVGNGPFSAVVDGIGFGKQLSAEDKVSFSAEFLQIGDVRLRFAQSELWDAKPDWEALNGKNELLLRACAYITTLLASDAPPGSFTELALPIQRKFAPDDAIFRKAEVAIKGMIAGLSMRDFMTMRINTRALAGLGSGLTPAGDDFLVGAMHALWACLPREEAQRISHLIREEASPRTNSLSAAWLRAAAKGQAGEMWHRLLNAIAGFDEARMSEAVARILPTGHTSGADALGAFVATVQALDKRSEGR